MASFDINFNANTTGDHYIGYRTYNDPANMYTVITVTVATPGLQAVTIDVPGNLYCAHSDIEYSGYIIAACQDQIDGNADGIPDLALTWTVTLLQQTDPCIKTDILCESVPIASITIDDNGTGSCAPDGVYPLTITEVTPGDEIVAANIDVTVTGGVVVSYTINNPGQYKVAPNLTHAITGCSSPAAFTAVMGSCPVLNLGNHDCQNQNDLTGIPDYTLDLGETARICADTSTLGSLASNFITTTVTDVSDDGNCHCESCTNVTVEPTGATSGAGKVTYQTCWDESNPIGSAVLMVTQIVNWNNTINLGCIIEDTLVMDQGTLDQPIVVSASAACS